MLAESPASTVSMIVLPATKRSLLPGVPIAIVTASPAGSSTWTDADEETNVMPSHTTVTCTAKTPAPVYSWTPGLLGWFATE